MTSDGGRPLAGVSVLVTRPRHQAEALAERIRGLGGEPVVAPTVEIRPGDRPALAEAARDLARGRFTVVCLTSANGVAAVAEALEDEGIDVRKGFASATVAAVGTGTAAALAALGIEPDIMPGTATTEALGLALPRGEGEVLLPRADIASPTLPAIVRQRGYTPVEVDAYVTEPPARFSEDVGTRLARGEIDVLTFTSPSTARGFAALVDDWSGAVVAIGPVTAAACRDLGMEVAAEATRHDVDGLVDAVVEAASRR